MARYVYDTLRYYVIQPMGCYVLFNKLSLFIIFSVYIWCMAHRLELSLKDVLKNTCFDDIDEILLCLYYLYGKECMFRLQFKPEKLLRIGILL